ncbi:hypothetical protein QE361_001992 [Sphingomonas sp. SORGH_AS802]|uniref:BLUF domain-containing protein n=1 Tax=unclassified Sphingomonas TaxID=196159 RepID=UPI0028606CD6|nr:MULTISPECIES: BLUF domain-containing protein [unclassified Sphingomonas]MDR6126623.1 hypothetical protein [Sphingomonas sp. SORGH_AS_0438]MDR6135009.1 hypothetical protein [Sphingomonas sp. SORGH_AS_0802]
MSGIEGAWVSRMEDAAPGQLSRVVYISRARTGSRQSDIASLLAQCDRNNPAEDLSGLLLADPTSYLQALEGPVEAVARRMALIRTDRRHSHIAIIAEGLIPARQFGHWAMIHRDQTAMSPEAFSRQVAVDVAAVDDIALKAVFLGFARMTV